MSKDKHFSDISINILSDEGNSILLEAEPFLMNDARVQLWGTMLQQVAKDLQDRDIFDRHSGSELRVMNTTGYP